MDNKKLMEAAEAVTRINALLKQEEWEITEFAPRQGHYRGYVRLVLEIARVDEDPSRKQEPQC
jgi:hypothetical protein